MAEIPSHQKTGQARDVLAYIGRAERYPEVGRLIDALRETPLEAMEAYQLQLQARLAQSAAEQQYWQARLAAIDVGA